VNCISVFGLLSSTFAPGAQAARVTSNTTNKTKTSIFFISLPLELFNLIGNNYPFKSYSKPGSVTSIGWGEFVSATWGMNNLTQSWRLDRFFVGP
jgi:hypothetical protein